MGREKRCESVEAMQKDRDEYPIQHPTPASGKKHEGQNTGEGLQGRTD